MVEALQRTLNARIKPSPGIGVDGDFGPETEGAVKKFQTQKGLTATGIVDAETWKALGPLVMDEEPAPEPAVVNAEAKNASRPIRSTARRSSRARPGRSSTARRANFWPARNEDEQRDPASTTKMMTAYLVTSLAEKDPEVLDEIVTFSERADKTSGSTSEVKAGEKLPVGELLYGLMLPSGNDASVAFAEHFGERLTPDATRSRTTASSPR